MQTLSKSLLAVGLLAALTAGAAYARLLPQEWVPGWMPQTPAEQVAAADGAAAGTERGGDRRGRRRAEGGEAREGRGERGSGRSGRRGGGGNGPVPVLVAEASKKDVPVILEGVGTARPLKTVTVRPQVDGTILRIDFKEGQDVAQGALLAEIDPAVYRSQRDQAAAKRMLTERQLENARLDLARYQKIPGVVAEKTVDTQRAQVAQLEAQLKADTAAVANAETVLGYTRINSPIAGRVGMRLVDEGNLVRSGDAGLAVITQIQPISVLFTLPQQRLAEVNRAIAAGEVQVEALGTDGRQVIDKGVLKVVDNQVDQQTGTVRMKADFPNAERQLWPGQFANVRVRVDTLKDVVAIPLAAVQRGPNGTFAYVVTPEARAEIRQITLGMMNDAEAVVTAGLEAGARVVTTGFGRLTDGARVDVGAPADPAGVTPPNGAQPNVSSAKDGAGAASAATPTGEESRGRRRRGDAARGERNEAAAAASRDAVR